MISETDAEVWDVIGKSVQGASHIRTGLPNQDAIKIHRSETSSGLPLIISVSDGHGSASYFRSNVGSSLAVNAANSVWHRLFEDQSEKLNHNTIGRSLYGHLPRTIYQHWRARVADHIAKNPFTPEELESLADDIPPDKLRDILLNPLTAYGATLLNVVVADSFVAYIRLGDGDIITVTERGEVSSVFGVHGADIGEETFSLCMQDHEKYWEGAVQDSANPKPALILLSSDGFSKSYTNEEGFLKVGKDIFEILADKDLEQVGEDLEDFLRQTSENGSADDITVGIASRIGRQAVDQFESEPIVLDESTDTEIDDLDNDDSKTEIDDLESSDQSESRTSIAPRSLIERIRSGLRMGAIRRFAFPTFISWRYGNRSSENEGSF